MTEKMEIQIMEQIYSHFIIIIKPDIARTKRQIDKTYTLGLHSRSYTQVCVFVFYLMALPVPIIIKRQWQIMLRIGTGGGFL
jgi:lipopolysaccharide export LptBFGC system permease protein LptF